MSASLASSPSLSLGTFPVYGEGYNVIRLGTYAKK